MVNIQKIIPTLKAYKAIEAQNGELYTKTLFDAVFNGNADVIQFGGCYFILLRGVDNSHTPFVEIGAFGGGGWVNHAAKIVAYAERYASAHKCDTVRLLSERKGTTHLAKKLGFTPIQVNLEKKVNIK